jgi:hypothetical protein
MEIPAALAADLALLAAALDGEQPSIEASLDALLLDLQVAVDSFVGCVVTVVMNDHLIVFSALPDAVDRSLIATSVRLPLRIIGAADAGGAMVFYAARSGAFVDLAADLGFALHLDPGMLVLDGDLPPPDRAIGLATVTHINRATGILIERGHTATAARGELDRLAEVADCTVHAAAQQLIASITVQPEPGTAL